MTVPSQNISYVEKQVKLDSNEDITLALSDTAGQERFSAMAPLYYKGAHAAIVVYDLTYKESLNKIEKWINELK
jgi:Ras-related protein Rab-21